MINDYTTKIAILTFLHQTHIKNESLCDPHINVNTRALIWNNHCHNYHSNNAASIYPLTSQLVCV